MREIVHLQAGQCGNQIGAKVNFYLHYFFYCVSVNLASCKNFLTRATCDALLSSKVLGSDIR